MTRISTSQRAQIAEMLIAGIRDELAKIRELEELLMQRKKEMIVAITVFRGIADADR